jgi:hypothetical protein
VAVSQGLKLGPNILHIPLDQSFQEGSELIELFVAYIIIEALDVDAIVWLCHEILRKIIYDDSLLDISAKLGQVFDVNSIAELGVISVQTVLDQALPIEVVQDPVRIVFQTRCEYYKLIMRVELLKKFKGPGTRPIIAVFLF